MPRVSRETKALALYLGLVSLLATAVFAWMGFNPSDEGYPLAASRRLLAGQLPHRDFITIRPAGSALLHLPWLLAGDYALVVSRAFHWLQVAALSLAWMFMLQRLLKFETSLTQRLLMSFVGFLFTGAVTFGFAWHTVDALFFTSVGLALCLSPSEPSNWWGYALLCCAALCKQTFALMTPIALLVLGDWRRVRCWIAACAPGLTYCLVLWVGGALPEMFHQLLSRQGEFTTLAVNPVVERWSALGLGAIFALTCLSLADTEPVQRLGPALFYGGAMGLAWSQRQPLIDMVALGSALGVAAFGLYKRRSGTRQAGLLVAALAWVASMSEGVNTPILASGALVLLLMSALWSENLRNELLVGNLILALVAGGACHQLRRRHLFHELPARYLSRPLAGLFPGGRGLWISPRTEALLSDLATARSLVRTERYAILPDFAGYWAVAPQPNPIPLDWPTSWEAPSPAMRERVRESLENQRGKTTFLVQKYRAEYFVNRYEPLESGAAIPATGLARYDAVHYLKRHFRKTGETRFFELFE